MAENPRRKKAREMLSRHGYKVGGHLTGEEKSEVDHEIERGMHEHDEQQHGGKKTRLRLRDGGSCEGMAGGGTPARAGRGKKGKTEINIVVGKPGGDQPTPVPVPVPRPAPPMGAGPPGMPPGGMPPHPPMAGPPGAPPGMPPGMPPRPPGMKHGGATKRKEERGDRREHRYMGGNNMVRPMPAGPAMAGPQQVTNPGRPMMAKRGGHAREK